MENSNEISIAQALNHVQSWLNANEFDKVIQGCQEILEIEPGNIRALSLMKLAEERRHLMVNGNPIPEPSPSPISDPSPAKDPLATLEVETPSPVTPPAVPQNTVPDIELPPEEDPSEEQFEKRKLFLAMLVPAILVVLIGGGIIWFLANRDRAYEIAETIEDDETIETLDYLEENDQRVKDIQNIMKIIEDYKLENGAYPSINKIESVIAQSDVFTEIPSDPRQGEIDKSGQVFGYIYSVYDGIGGKDSIYILSALFEDNKGFGTAWAQGAPIKNYPNFRDYKRDQVTFIGGDEDEVETVGKGLNEPKVNPDN